MKRALRAQSPELRISVKKREALYSTGKNKNQDQRVKKVTRKREGGKRNPRVKSGKIIDSLSTYPSFQLDRNEVGKKQKKKRTKEKKMIKEQEWFRLQPPSLRSVGSYC